MIADLTGQRSAESKKKVRILKTILLACRIKEGEFLMSFLPAQEIDGTSLTWTTEFESD
jgi:hypothetical protein